MSSSAENPAKKMITLRSSDGEVFDIEEAVALESQTIKQMIEVDCSDSAIPLPNVTGKILSKVIEYCRRHVEAAASATNSVDKVASAVSNENLKSFDTDFVKVDQATLFDLMLLKSANIKLDKLAHLTSAVLITSDHSNLFADAANYLDIKSLIDLTCRTVADMIKDNTPEEIRKAFNITNDFTPEEEEEVRTENYKPMYNSYRVTNDWGPVDNDISNLFED